jgi:hypothetical protein
MAAVERQWWFVGEFGDPESVHVVSNATTPPMLNPNVLWAWVLGREWAEAFDLVVYAVALSRGSLLPRPRRRQVTGERLR